MMHEEDDAWVGPTSSENGSVEEATSGGREKVEEELRIIGYISVLVCMGMCIYTSCHKSMESPLQQQQQQQQQRKIFFKGMVLRKSKKVRYSKRG